MAGTKWTNWARNQSFVAGCIERPGSEDEAVDVIAKAIRRGDRVRVAGGGHSFTPIVETNGTLLDLSRLSGLITVDDKAQTAVVYGGSRIADLGEPLWLHGLSIANQGDIDVQSIAGAVATGTKGSSTAHGSMSSMVNSLRVVNGSAEAVDITEGDLELLRAGQVSLGLLGPVLRVGLKLVPRYRLREENTVLPLDEVLRQWDHFLAEYRHFSFWWMPTDRSSAMYKLGDVPADHCFVKLLREISHDAAKVPVGEPNKRTDYAYRIYPDGTTEAEFHELEYMVSSDEARDAVEMLRTLMLRDYPDEISPLQVRWQKRDDAFLSPQSRRDSTSLSVSGEIGRDYWPFLRAVDQALQPYGARPHWGKLHFLTAERIAALYPQLDRFQAVRRAFDPSGLFLNDHLAALFS